MSRSDTSAGRTVRYAAVLVLGSAAFIALLTSGLIRIARTALSGEVGSGGEEGEPSGEGSSEAAEEAPGGPDASSRSLRVCCAALEQNARSAPLEQKGMYTAAAEVCRQVDRGPNRQAARAQVRAALAGARAPAACR